MGGPHLASYVEGSSSKGELSVVGIDNALELPVEGVLRVAAAIGRPSISTKSILAHSLFIAHPHRLLTMQSMLVSALAWPLVIIVQWLHKPPAMHSMLVPALAGASKVNVSLLY